MEVTIKKIESLGEGSDVEQKDKAVAVTSVKVPTIKYTEHGNMSMSSNEEDACSVSKCSKSGVDIIEVNKSIVDHISDVDSSLGLAANDKILSLDVVATDPDKFFFIFYFF